MKKLVVIRYLAYITFILIFFSMLPGGTFAAKSLSEGENQYANKTIIDTENYEKESSENATENSSSENLNTENRTRIQDKDKYTAYKLEREKIREELQLQKNEYREAKGDFLKIRDRIQTGKLNPGSEEAINGTKIYLNSSISYMIAHLKNVKTNMQYSNSNGTEEKIDAVNGSIKLLEAEQAKVANASNQKELIVSVRAVREIWTNAQEASLTGSGQIVSQRIGEFLYKSENLSEELNLEIQSLNETGVNTADLQTRLVSYNLYIEAAQSKKEAADTIYEDENSSRKDLEVANNYLRESLNNVNKANQILKIIFEELKEHGFKEINGIENENDVKTELNNTTYAN